MELWSHVNFGLVPNFALLVVKHKASGFNHAWNVVWTTNRPIFFPISPPLSAAEGKIEQDGEEVASGNSLLDLESQGRG